MTVLSLVDRVRRVCGEWGVEVRLVQTYGKGLGDHGAGGWFMEDDKRIEVACDRPAWVECLAHEFGHVQQWREGAFTDALNEAYSKHDAWLSGTLKAPAKDVTRWIRAVQTCERDAERRAVTVLVEEGALSPDDVGEYVRGANTYVMAYEAARQLRKWPKHAGAVRDLVHKMPSTFVDDLGALPPGALRLYTQCAKANA